MTELAFYASIFQIVIVALFGVVIYQMRQLKKLRAMDLMHTYIQDIFKCDLVVTLYQMGVRQKDVTLEGKGKDIEDFLNAFEAFLLPWAKGVIGRKDIEYYIPPTMLKCASGNPFIDEVIHEVRLESGDPTLFENYVKFMKSYDAIPDAKRETIRHWFEVKINRLIGRKYGSCDGCMNWEWLNKTRICKVCRDE